jgi:Helix-turn-helix domain
VEHQQTDVRQVSGRVVSADDTERFLRELRELRDGAGLGHAELAARAHYPYDTIKAAEVGPALPDLPVLSAFVRGCGGTVEEWEERWRSLTSTPSLPVSEARDAGNSAAAVAGARIGSVTQVTDNPDPSIIMAALNRVAEGMASGSDGTPPPSDDASSWPDFPLGAAADEPAGFEPDVLAVPQPDVPAVPQPDVRAGFEPDDPATPVPADKPKAGRLPSGWDPIRVSTAWPAIPDSPIDAALSAEAPPWESASWAQNPSPASAAPAAVPAGWSTTPGAAHAPAVAARSARRPASRAGSAGPSRAWIVAVAVVLLCVLAVMLAIFA